VRKEEEREEGRTSSHVSDTGCIPLGEITVERRGRVKRYTKENKKIKSHTEKERKYKKNYLVNNKIHYQ